MSLKDEILSRVNGGDTDVQTEGERVGENQTSTPQPISKPTVPRFQLPPNVGVNAFKKAANDVVNAGLPDVMAQKRRENILSYETRKPTQPAATPAPEPAPQYQQPKIMRLRDIIDSIRRSEEGTPEEQEKRRRRERSRKSIAAIGDAISAASNLVATANYAPAAKQTSLSARMQAYYDKLREDREKRRDVYNNAYIRAMEKDNQMAYQQAKDDYERAVQKEKDELDRRLKEGKITGQEYENELNRIRKEKEPELIDSKIAKNKAEEDSAKNRNKATIQAAYIRANGKGSGGSEVKYTTSDGKGFETKEAAIAHIDREMHALGASEDDYPKSKSKRSTKITKDHKGQEKVDSYTDTTVEPNYNDWDRAYDRFLRKKKKQQAAQTTTQKKTSSGKKNNAEVTVSL